MVFHLNSRLIFDLHARVLIACGILRMLAEESILEMISEPPKRR